MLGLFIQPLREDYIHIGNFIDLFSITIGRFLCRIMGKGLFDVVDGMSKSIFYRSICFIKKLINN